MSFYDENAQHAFDDDDEHEEEEDQTGEGEETAFPDDCDRHLLESSDSEDSTCFQTGLTDSLTCSSSTEGSDATPLRASSTTSSSFVTEEDSAPFSGVTQLITANELQENYSNCSASVVHASVKERTSMLWAATAPSLQGMRYVVISEEHKNEPYTISLIKDPKTTVFFSLVEISIMFSSMHDREKFGQFNLSTSSGNASATLLSLFGEAFSDPSIGSLKYSSSTGGVYTHTGCHTFELHGERRSKGVVFFEMLCSDDYGLHSMSDNEQAMNVHKFCSQANIVVGYRMVIGFCDPEIRPDEAIRRRIAENARLAGTTMPHVKIDINNKNSKELLSQMFDNDTEKFEKYVEIHNKKADAANFANAKLAAATKDWTPSSPGDYHRQVTNYYLYYVLGIAPFYEFQELEAGHEITATLSTTDPNDNAIQTITGCYANFSFKNEHASERLSDYGVCDIQCNMAGYISPVEDAPAYLKAEELKFPMRALVYCTSFLPHIKPSVLMNLPFPWAIQPIEIALESQRDLVKHRQESAFRERDSAMLDDMDPEGVEYFGQMSMANDFQHDSMVHRLVRRHNDVAEVNDLYYTKTLGGLRMPTTESANADNNNVFRVTMPIDDATEQHLKWLEEIEKCSPSLTEDARLMFMELLSQSGGRLLQSLFNTHHKNHIPMMTSAIVFLRTKEQRQETMYHEMVTTFDEFGVFGSYMAEMLLVMTDVVGLSTNADVANDVRICTNRVIHSHKLERYYGDSGDKNNFLFYGAPGSGKTHTSKKLADDCFLPGTIENSMSMSERANNTYSARGGLLYKDEADATIDPSLAHTPQAKTLLAQAKSAITNHECTHTLLTWDPEAKGKNQIYSRKTAHLITPWIAVRLAAVNERVIGDEPSFAFRWLADYWKNAIEAHNKMRLLNSVMPVSDSGRSQDPMKSALIWYREMFHKEQAFHTLVASAIAVGKLPYPNTQMLRIYWHVIAAEMVDIIPTFLTNIRAAGTYLESYGKALCVTTAVQIMFRETSPLISFDPETGETKARPFDLEQVGLVKPYLFLHESAAIFAITRYVHRYILPFDWYIVADAIAREFCQFYGSGDVPAGNRPSFDKEAGPHGEIEVLSVVKHTTTMHKLISRICALTGHTHNTATEILGLLQNQLINTPWMYADTSNKNSGGPEYAGHRKIPFLSLQEETSAFSKTVTIRISTYYLTEMSPSKVMARMLRTISHKGIRPRHVMLGVASPKEPSTFLTAKLGPGQHTLKVPKSCVMSKGKQAMFFDSGLTNEKRTVMPGLGTIHASNKEVVFDGDVETMLYVKWAASVGITNEAEQMAWCPKNIDADIRYKHKVFGVYKNKIIKRYPQGLTDGSNAASSSSSSLVSASPRQGEMVSEAPKSKNAQVIKNIWDGNDSFARRMGEIDQRTLSSDPISFTTTTDTIQLAQFSRSTTVGANKQTTTTTSSSNSSFSPGNPLDKIRGTTTTNTSRKRRNDEGSSSFSSSSLPKRVAGRPLEAQVHMEEQEAPSMGFFNIAQ